MHAVSVVIDLGEGAPVRFPQPSLEHARGFVSSYFKRMRAEGFRVIGSYERGYTIKPGHVRVSIEKEG